jgi:hypothetical protein
MHDRHAQNLTGAAIMTERPAIRADLRELDGHASWREVYVALDCPGAANHES